MPAKRLLSRIDITDLRKGIRDAEKVLEECASVKGSPYIEKVSSNVIEVGCIYEAPEEATVETVGNVKYEHRSIEVVMPFDLDDPKKLEEAKGLLRKIEKFVDECRSAGGEASITKSAKMTAQGVKIPAVVVTCTRRV